MFLHTRNLKYGKLASGTLVTVSPNLIKRCKQHFQRLGDEIGVEVILGLNGFIWLQEAPLDRDSSKHAGGDAANDDSSLQASVIPVTLAGRERVCRVRNCILALSRQVLPIWSATIVDVYLASVAQGMAAKDILASEDNIALVTHTARERTRA